eukprot:6021351-Pyramimonas_sp.AAC.1
MHLYEALRLRAPSKHTGVCYRETPQLKKDNGLLALGKPPQPRNSGADCLSARAPLQPRNCGVAAAAASSVSSSEQERRDDDVE